MCNKKEHFASHALVRQDDGSYELVLRQPCCEVNRELFDAELEFALEASRGLKAPVRWVHNAVRVSTDDEKTVGAWMAFTERNAAMAN